jgi:NADPH:quinone reductase-like Zn-dependent oxidoreductase
MQAVQQDEPNGRLVTREVPVPRPGPGEVLVRMAAAPINPSDLGSLRGLSYEGTRKYPFIPGVEGSGTVVANGSGMMARMLLGKRVACTVLAGHGGTWAQYMVTSAQQCIPLERGVDLDKAAMLVVNPLTALAMIEMAKDGGHRAIVNTVAASALGAMILSRARHEGIPLVNVVRRPSQVDVVRSRGAEYVLDSSEADFAERLHEVAERLQATLLLDAVGGEMTGRLAGAAPYGSTIVLYSKMSEEDCRVDPFTVLVKNLRLQGWFLPNWLKTKNAFQAILLSRKAQSLLDSDLSSHVGQRVPLSSAQEALEKYVQAMTNQKVLFQMGDEN